MSTTLLQISPFFGDHDEIGKVVPARRSGSLSGKQMTFIYRNINDSDCAVMRRLLNSARQSIIHNEVGAEEVRIVSRASAIVLSRNVVASLLSMVAFSLAAHAQPLTFQTVQAPTGATELVGINNKGEVIGLGNPTSLGVPASFTSKPPYTTFEVVAVPGALSTTATGINDIGLVCGFYTSAQTAPDGLNVFGFVRTFDWRGYHYLTVRTPSIDLGNYFNNGVLLGFSDSGHAFGNNFIYDLASGTFTPFHVYDPRETSPTGNQIGAEIGGMNRFGEVVGSIFNGYPIGYNLGFGWRLGSTRVVTINAGNYTYLNGVNNRGQAVGYYRNILSADEARHGAVFNAESGGYATLDVPGAAETVLYSVNDADQAVGIYIDTAGAHGVVVSGLTPNYRPK